MFPTDLGCESVEQDLGGELVVVLRVHGVELSGLGVRRRPGEQLLAAVVQQPQVARHPVAPGGLPRLQPHRHPSPQRPQSAAAKTSTEGSQKEATEAHGDAFPEE